MKANYHHFINHSLKNKTPKLFLWADIGFIRWGRLYQKNNNVWVVDNRGSGGWFSILRKLEEMLTDRIGNLQCYSLMSKKMSSRSWHSFMIQLLLSSETFSSFVVHIPGNFISGPYSFWVELPREHSFTYAWE